MCCLEGVAQEESPQMLLSTRPDLLSEAFRGRPSTPLVFVEIRNRASVKGKYKTRRQRRRARR